MRCVASLLLVAPPLVVVRFALVYFVFTGERSLIAGAAAGRRRSRACPAVRFAVARVFSESGDAWMDALVPYFVQSLTPCKARPPRRHRSPLCLRFLGAKGSSPGRTFAVSDPLLSLSGVVSSIQVGSFASSR